MNLIAVDVGTTSARAGVVTRDGVMLARTTRPIALQRMGADRAEHQSEDIWAAVCAAVRAAVAEAGIDPATVAGIGFDATCSLVVRDKSGGPLSVAPDGAPGWDTIVWLDHRAREEARALTASGTRVRDYFGGTFSPEMEIPKLMWLKRHLPEAWARAGAMYDLADFLTFRASGSGARSQSTLTSKWGFLAHEKAGWDPDFLKAAGLEDIVDRAGLPSNAMPIGSDLGPLTPDAARALGLPQTCRVAAGMVDAHAGALGVLGAYTGNPDSADRHMGLVAGTSSAVIVLSREPRAAKGLWGPHFGAVVPGLWLNEGGQSASGGALDYLLEVHSAGGVPNAATHETVIKRIAQMRADAEGADIAPRLHVLPDFHGNRTPFADPEALGVVSGLNLDTSFDGLCKLYWRTAVAIAAGIRQILETLRTAGYTIDILHVTGGHTRNPLLMELYADVTGCIVRELPKADAMILGSAMGAATAAGLYPDLAAAGAAMCAKSVTRVPEPARTARYEKDYAVFLKLHAQRKELEVLF
ncbi:FGGY-family carbohydrate kinase [Pelagibacterium xiamenense]|uniref:FGGY-family carbohydrate kinase n=1 Tax=Pelagibacterium xiamenense TaxID=2901140 RepID=UPI001E546FBA|nr:FGGY-family carbohydrate kinase [Pelagibacterium xiamenense]MCD7058794.1 FGGY-family carbohydrate kinase [Pelagibacterium xiamenense]